MRGRSRCQRTGLRRFGSGLPKVVGLSLSELTLGTYVLETANPTVKTHASNDTTDSNTRDDLCA